jgi:hypothetical protein
MRRLLLLVLFALFTGSVNAALLLEVTHGGGKAFVNPTQPGAFFASAFDPLTNRSYSMGGELASEAEVGHVFTATPDVFEVFERVLTSPVPSGLGFSTIEQFNEFSIPSAVGYVKYPLPFQLSWNRHAPVLGPNLSGYDITEITLTVDRFDVITITPSNPPVGSHRGQLTFRVFGEVVPEPATWMLLTVAAFFMSLNLRPTRLC